MRKEHSGVAPSWEAIELDASSFFPSSDHTNLFQISTHPTFDSITLPLSLARTSTTIPEMPSTKVRLTWTVEVPMPELGGNLELFGTLVPGIQMLRMCNRLGQGPEAHIAKLPVELVSLIEEEYILDAMRADSRRYSGNWVVDHSCWTSSCIIEDYFGGNRMIEIYNDDMKDRFAKAGICPCYCGRKYDDYLRGETSCANSGPLKKNCDLWATNASRDVVNHVTDLAKADNSIADEYEICCQRRKANWEARTTRASDGSCPWAQLDWIETLLTAHFGLEIWVNNFKVVSCTAARSHSKTDEVQGENLRSYMLSHLSTEAFIRLPSSSTPSAQPESVERSRRRDGPDISFAFDTTMPMLSKESAARFARAKRLLHLTQADEKPALRLLINNREED